MRTVHPIISIICADLMEAMYYTGTRSSGGLYPCPRCLVPSDELSQLSKALDGNYDQRTHHHMQSVYENSLRPSLTEHGRDEILKRFGLHDVNVCSEGIRCPQMNVFDQFY